MMELFIDDRLAELDSLEGVSVSLSVASVTSPEYGRAGYSKSMSIPMTARNRELMGDCEQIHSRDRFNSRRHTARVEADGFVIMEGTMVLTGCSCSARGMGSYDFNIIGSGKAWASHAAARSLSSLFPAFSTVVNGQAIRESWTADTPVRWLPVQRELYVPSSGVGLQQVERVLTSSDYHPFLNVRSMVEAIFADAGYSVVSGFMDGEWFGSLYMSGNYPSRDATLLKERMDFLAVHSGRAAAVADTDGRVYADPYRSYNSLGNIVDTANPDEPESPDGVFANGGCFRKIDDRVAFVPLYTVAAGFEYRLRYTTDYRIGSSAELAGFNTVYLGNGDVRELGISNRFADRREEFRADKSFRWIIFEHNGVGRHELVAEIETASGIGTVVVASTTLRSVPVYTAVQGNYTRLRVMYYGAGSVGRPYTGDWALYDGYVEEEGSTQVEVVLRSGAETLTPASPKYFDDIYFGGAEAGMNFTLLSAEVRPLFMPHPAEGSRVEFRDVAAHGCSRLDLMSALRQMFNLCFYTDPLEKRVYIEPRTEFHNGPVVNDWSDRADLSKPYIVEELGGDMARRLTFRYQGGDGAVARHNSSEGDDFGAWSAVIDNAYATDEETVYENPLFTPSLNITGCLPSSPSASWLQAGDGYYGDNLNFAPKIVHFSGMRSLPEGERWGWPSHGDSYPAAAFERGDGTTLCFEDRDGRYGLSRFWSRNIDLYNNGRRLTVWIRLAPQDIEALVRPNRMKHDFRALFRLAIDGEFAVYSLEEIVDYDPAAASTKCLFISVNS